MSQKESTVERKKVSMGLNKGAGTLLVNKSTN